MKRRTPSHIIRLYEVLVRYAAAGTSFQIAELSSDSGVNAADLERMLGAELQEVILPASDGFQVIPDLVRVRLDDFSALFRRKRRLFSTYDLMVTSNVLIFEFFMPLAREDRLREVLDNLFYRDTIEQRIREIGIDRIRAGLKLPASMTDQALEQLVHSFFDTAVGGYSMYMVSGRYRSGALLSRQAAVTRSPVYGPYIVDETTAVVRFIFPLEETGAEYRHGLLLEPAVPSGEVVEQAGRISWLFLNFFAQAVIRVVHEEDEIWLLESGLRNAFYRWVRQEQQPGDHDGSDN